MIKSLLASHNHVACHVQKLSMQLLKVGLTKSANVKSLREGTYQAYPFLFFPAKKEKVLIKGNDIMGFSKQHSRY